MMNPGNGCGVGNVNFQIVYMDGGSPKLLDEWTKTCTGNMIDVNIDLSPLAGKKVQFGLVWKPWLQQGRLRHLELSADREIREGNQAVR